MNIKLLLSAAVLAACGFASAQSVVESTDPAKIAEIERHAQQLGAQPPAAAPAGGRMHHGDRMDREHMRQGMDQRMGKHKHMHKHMRDHMRGHGGAKSHHHQMHGTRAAIKPAPDMAPNAAAAGMPAPAQQ